MTEHKALEVANVLLDRAHKQNIAVSNMKLQKLLYYLQGWNLAVRGEEVFAEEFKKWAWGPVVPPVYNKFRKSKAENILEPHGEIPIITTNLEKAIQFVLNHYGHYTAVQLALMSHEEEPFINAEEFGIISKIDMLRYFADLRDKLYPGSKTN